MVGEVFAGISAFSTMFNIAKAMKDMDDAVKRNAAVHDLWEQITAVQERYTAAIEEVGNLKKQLARFEAWETEKEKYELKVLGGHGVVMMLKPAARGAAQAHWLCPNCYEHGNKSYFQRATASGVYLCPACKANFTQHGGPHWVD